MKIVFKVEDFLKIEKAEIDITNFCVFIGNNNSGKNEINGTYLRNIGVSVFKNTGH